MPSHFLLPSMCVLCCKEGGSLNHLFFDCAYARCCWVKPFNFLKLLWVSQTSLEKMSSFYSMGLGRKVLQKFFGSQNYGSKEIKEYFKISLSHRLLASTWSSQHKAFESYSTQDDILNWSAFIFREPDQNDPKKGFT